MWKSGPSPDDTAFPQPLPDVILPGVTNILLHLKLWFVNVLMVWLYKTMLCELYLEFWKWNYRFDEEKKTEQHYAPLFCVWLNSAYKAETTQEEYW